ncbi:hypothetical protein K438DRAFT_1973855 [Mycena galopus ATCC 62051]|nr:hypothetical protein K438DRAFT_1973855 [Mycena galopus ATCC 62051]
MLSRLPRHKRLTHWLHPAFVLEYHTSRSWRWCGHISRDTLYFAPGVDANAIRPSLLPSSASCAPPSSSSPPRRGLACRSWSPPSDSRWLPPRHPRSPPAPRLVNPLPSPPSTHPTSSVLPPPTPPSPASLGGRNFASSTQYLRRLPVILPPLKAMLQASGASRESTPLPQLVWQLPQQCVCVRDGGGGGDAWIEEAEGCVNGKRRGVGVPESLVPRDRGVHQKWDMQVKRADRIDTIAPRMIPTIQLADAVRTDTSGTAGIGDDASSRDVTTHSYMHVFAGAEARHSPE